MTLDLLITGAKIYDGTGSDWLKATIGVEDDKIRILRRDVRGIQASRVLDATGLSLAPGFIDMHAHSTMVILNQPEHEPKVRQGVTTELIGVDGNSYAPFEDSADLERWAAFNAGLDGRKSKGTWSSVAEYLDLYDRRVAVNIAYVVGNSQLRIATTGWGNNPPSGSDMARMKDILKNAMAEGALGMSTGLTYPPGSYASTEELTELCGVVRAEGGMHVSHVRYGAGEDFRDPFFEAVQISRDSGVPLHISHYASLWKKNGQFKPLLALVDEARAEGIQVTFDAYPYNYGGSRATVALPDWVQDGGPDLLRERLGDPRARALMREEPDVRQSRWRAPAGWHLTGFQQDQNLVFEGLNLHEVAARLSRDPLDALCDLLLEENLGLSYVGHNSNSSTNVRKILEHPQCMVGSDGLLVGAFPSPRTYGTFPKMLGDLVREEELMTTAEAIRKMTSFPAQLLGLSDRGTIREGAKADLVLFDEEEVGSRASLENPRVFADGIPYVIVNGILVIDDNHHTGATPGRALRRTA